MHLQASTLLFEIFVRVPHDVGIEAAEQSIKLVLPLHGLLGLEQLAVEILHAKLEDRLKFRLQVGRSSQIPTGDEFCHLLLKSKLLHHSLARLVVLLGAKLCQVFFKLRAANL